MRTSSGSGPSSGPFWHSESCWIWAWERPLQKTVASKVKGDDIEGVNRVVSTVFWSFMGVGVLIMVLALVFREHLFAVIDVPDSHLERFTPAYLWFFLGVALTFPLGVFGEILAGVQRVDVINFVQIGTTLLNASLVLFMVHHGEGIEHVMIASTSRIGADGVPEYGVVLSVLAGVVDTSAPLRPERSRFAVEILPRRLLHHLQRDCADEDGSGRDRGSARAGGGGRLPGCGKSRGDPQSLRDAVGEPDFPGGRKSSLKRGQGGGRRSSAQEFEISLHPQHSVLRPRSDLSPRPHLSADRHGERAARNIAGRSDASPSPFTSGR